MLLVTRFIAFLSFICACLSPSLPLCQRISTVCVHISFTQALFQACLESGSFEGTQLKLDDLLSSQLRPGLTGEGAKGGEEKHARLLQENDCKAWTCEVLKKELKVQLNLSGSAVV